ncbi:3'(2'),5'-bisphosphate nucleotidase CysQ, partial [Campylobacter upsaliensis]|nr:3'(2'),5'-bisphosphate nucleotidase CysQ [Campylobacter upsaliensis]
MNLDSYLNLALDAAEKASRAILKEKENLKILPKEDGTALTSA